MAFQQGIHIGQHSHILIDGVFKDGGPAGQALLRHQVLRPKGLLQQAGPALVLIEANAAIRAIGGICAVTVGIGIADTENVLFHRMFLPSVFLPV